MESTDELTQELFALFNGFSSWENSIIRQSDVTVSEVHAIEILGTYGSLNMKDLAQKSGVTTGTTTVTVDRLEKKNYARREIVKEDRRVYLITLTEKGRQIFAEHHQYHTKLTEQILAAMSEEESGQFLKLLKKINHEAF